MSSLTSFSYICVFIKPFMTTEKNCFIEIEINIVTFILINHGLNIILWCVSKE